MPAPTGALPAFGMLHPLAALLAPPPGGFSRINDPFVLTCVVPVVTLRAFSGYALSCRASAFGALACIPAFMPWVFVAWCRVFGVQVAAKAQPSRRQGTDAQRV